MRCYHGNPQPNTLAGSIFSLSLPSFFFLISSLGSQARSQQHKHRGSPLAAKPAQVRLGRRRRVTVCEAEGTGTVVGGGRSSSGAQALQGLGRRMFTTCQVQKWDSFLGSGGGEDSLFICLHPVTVKRNKHVLSLFHKRTQTFTLWSLGDEMSPKTCINELSCKPTLCSLN